MKFPGRIALLVIPLLLASIGTARSNLASDYIFLNGTGSAIDMTGSTTMMVSGDDDVWSSAQTIGFDFDLDGQSFSYFITSTNGPMVLGTSSSLSFSYIYAYNSFNSANCPHPIVTAFFDDLVASGNGVRTKLVGTAPNRIRVVDWEAYVWYGSGTDTEFHFQVRLYEGSNKIELWYGEMGSEDETNGNGQIGAALSTSNYISIGAGSSPVASGSIYVNDLSTRPIAENTMYTLRPCQKQFTIAGDVAQGGTARMDSGSVLLSGFRSKVGTPLPLEPFTISMGEFPCTETTYRYEISGDAAADYSVTPAQGSIGSLSSLTPTLQFQPTDTGEREATLTITGTNGFNRSYRLVGNGFRCVDWVGDPLEGGTRKLENGDTLLVDFQVPIGSSQNYTPISIHQLSSDEGCADPVSIQYTLNDPGGNYMVTPASEVIPVGGVSRPTITFNAQNGVGHQEATLTVNADGERRTFLLRDFISAPGGEIRRNGVAIGSETRLFRDEASCVGEAVMSLEMEAVNLGTGDFVVHNVQGYRLDTVIGTGTPPYPLLKDNAGQPLQTQDYFLSVAQGAAPRDNNARLDSIVVPEGQTRTFYLNIIAERPGKRYARLYFPTNAFNLNEPDVTGEPTQGMVSSSVFARGLGAFLAKETGSDRPDAVSFAPTKVRESRTMTASLYNGGDCDLRIDRDRFKFESGDVAEFELMNVTGGTPSGDFWILNPGEQLDVTVRFTPSRSGTRVATLRLVTNDSTLVLPGIIERGVFYWEFYGPGKLDLEARDLKLPPAVIGAESSTGFVQIENTKVEPVLIDRIEIVGGNDEIMMDPNKPWPPMPFNLGPGMLHDLGIIMTPDPNGAPGVREAEILIILANGDTTFATITGYAGTRELTVAPAALFQTTQIPVGDLAREYMVISNLTTLPVAISDIAVTGADQMFYTVQQLHRRVIEPGQTEFLEVTYLPGAPGQHSATIEITSNATNGMQMVTLGGEGTSTIGGGGDGADASRTQFGQPGSGSSSKNARGAQALQISSLSQIHLAPNPTQGVLNVMYTLAEKGMFTCDVYSADGRHVLSVESTMMDAGDHQLHADLRDLDQGAYFIRLRFNDEVYTTNVSVLR